uniref:G protein-coupled receptor n=1 Tax=Parascaris univalens TaxID=6257 RepID=A0A915C9P6_PARUN
MDCNVSLILFPSKKVCRNLGWSCPELHNPSRIVYLSFIIIRWALSAFIIFLSRKIISHDIIKHFTLNLITICILCDMFLAIRECIAVAQLYAIVFHSGQTLVMFNALTQFFADVATIQYRAMSLFVVFVMYLLFAFPFRMRQFLSGKGYKYYFISVHLLTPLACLPRFLAHVVRDLSTLTMLRQYNTVAPYAVIFTAAILLLLITLLRDKRGQQLPRTDSNAVFDDISAFHVNVNLGNGAIVVGLSIN